jgi:hypothetical protein
MFYQFAGPALFHEPLFGIYDAGNSEQQVKPQRRTRMKKLIRIAGIIFLWLLCIFGCPACAYNGTSSVTISLINSRSPAVINAGGTNKQAGPIVGAETLTEQTARDFRYELALRYQEQEETYQDALNAGIPKELARCVLPVGRYTRMRASANLRNWLAFLALRDHSAAQWEIRQYALAVSRHIADLFPRTWLLFNEGRGA